MVKLSEMGSWSQGMSSSSGKKPERERDLLKLYNLPDTALDKEREPSMLLNQDKEPEPLPIAEIAVRVIEPEKPRQVRSASNHLSGISGMLSELMRQAEPHTSSGLGYGGLTGDPVTPPKLDLSAPYIEDIDAFIEEFCMTAPQKYGHDVFRKHEYAPSFIVDDFDASNREKAVRQAWVKAREKLGFEGDNRYLWEKIAEMSFDEVIALQANAGTDGIQFPENHEIVAAMRKIHSAKTIEGSTEDQKEILISARAKLAKTSNVTISAQAALLSFEDLSAVRSWGREFEQARVDGFRKLNDLTIKTAVHIDTEVSNANAALLELLKAKKAGRARKAWNRAINWSSKPGGMQVAPLEIGPDGETKWADTPDETIDPRFMNDEQRAQAEKVLVQNLEDAMRATIAIEDKRINFAEKAAEIAGSHRLLIWRHRRALNKNRERIISEARQVTSIGEDSEERAIVSGDKVKHAQSAIDDRLAALEDSAQICEREQIHYESIAELHRQHKESLRSAVDHSLERLRNLERTQQQVILTQNVSIAGKYAQNLKGMKLEKQLRVITDRLRAARAEEVESLIALKDAMDTDEMLVLDHQKPAGLLSYQKTFAITDQSKSLDKASFSPTPN